MDKKPEGIGGHKLTARQMDYIRFIKDYYKENLVLPTYQETADHFGLKSRSTVYEAISRLRAYHQLENDVLINCPICGKVMPDRPDKM